MAQISFTPAWLKKLPFSSNRIHYTDSHPRSKYPNFDLLIITGVRTKTAYLRHIHKSNRKQIRKLIKLADMTSGAVGLSELRDIYQKKVIEFQRNDNGILLSRDLQKFSLRNAIDFYLENNNPQDRQNFIKLKDEPFKSQTVGHFILKDLEDLDVQEIIKPLIDKGSLYSANMKREFIQRAWNYTIKNHREVRKILRGYPNPATFNMQKKYGFVKEASAKYLGFDDILEFFDIVATCHRSDLRDFFHLALYLGQHPFGEIAKMRWDQLQEVDGQLWWIMEKGFHKVNRSHQIPLHATAMDIINKWKGSHDVYVFPNTASTTKELYDQHDFKYIMKQFRRKHEIKWDMRCLRSTFITLIADLDPTFKPQYLANQYESTVTNSNYLHRSLISYQDLKIDMINAYMNLIQDKLSEVSK